MLARTDSGRIGLLACGLAIAALLASGCPEVSPELDLGGAQGDSSQPDDLPIRDATDPDDEVNDSADAEDAADADATVDAATDPGFDWTSDGPDEDVSPDTASPDSASDATAGPDVIACSADCSRPNTEGGTCADGQCGGWICAENWGDCNDNLGLDGCETPLNTANDCGECDEPCTGGDHFVADCGTGVCARACDDPWENCDGDWDNGCEIPAGVPNQCDVNGLNPVDGCWTAHCGSLSHMDARNFGTWYCFECTTCHVPAAGRCQWCSHSMGRWFPDDACNCGSSEDLLCSFE